MNVFFSAIGWNCAEHLKEVLDVFEKLRANDFEFYLSVGHGVFPEVAELGYSSNSDDGTAKIIMESKVIDDLFVSQVPIYEKDLRNKTLKNLHDHDLLWLIDLQDEIYTVENIYDICDFIRKHPFAQWFKVNFKNYVGETTWIDDFCPPRIWRVGPHDGIKGFYYDNDIEYNDGSRANNLPHLTIPKSVAFVKHLSWVGSPEYLKRKILFQHKHYGHCSYRWNEETQELEFDTDFYKSHGQALPEVFVDES